ncbi:MAG: PAS domain S-box protein [Prolixibacteraceae bacterium]
MKKQNIKLSESENTSEQINERMNAFLLLKKNKAVVHLFLILLLSILSAEILIMFIIARFPIESTLKIALINTALLLIIVFPLVYFLLFRRLTNQINIRTQTEEKLENSLSILEATLNSIHNGILVVDHQGNVLKTNAKFAELWKIPNDILASGNDKMLIDYIVEQLLDRDGFLSSITGLYHEPLVDSLDLIHFEDGKIFERISKPFFIKGIPNGRVWSFLDITTRKQFEDTLSNERLLLRTVIDNIPDSIYCKDLDSRKTLVNQAELNYMGVQHESEVLGLNDFDSFPKELAEKFFADDQMVIKSGIPVYNREEYLFNKDGQKRWLLTSKLPLRDMDNQIIGLVGIGRDITSRKRAEEALKESALVYRNLVEKMPDGVYKSTHEGKFIEVNPAMVQMLGYDSKEELLSININSQLYFKPDERISLTLLEKLQDLGIFRLKRKDGTELWAEDHGWYVLDDEGKILFHEGVIRDVTDRKRTEDLLRISEERYRTIIDNIGEGICLVNDNEEFEFANSAAEKIFGVQHGKLVGKNLKDFLPDKKYEQILTDTLRRLTGEKSVYEIEIIRPGGEIRTLNVTAVAQIDRDKGFLGTYGVFRDITERKQVFEEINQKNNELIRLNAEKDKFFSIIAHDLRSPFNSFLGFTNIMAEEMPLLTNGQIYDFVVTMKSSANNLYRLLNNLLEWSQIQNGTVRFSPETVQFYELVEEILSLTSVSAMHKEIVFLNKIPENIEIFADKNMIQTVLRNLLSNASKFTRDGGKIEVKMKPLPDNSIEVAIADTGIGMSRFILENLFRIDVKTNRKGTEGEPSTGLGLLLCKEFVEKHGGKIWVESVEEKGSIFYFTLPQNDLAHK